MSCSDVLFCFFIVFLLFSGENCLTKITPFFLSPQWGAQRCVHCERAQQTASAATLSVWAAAQSPIVTQHVLHVCITITKAAAWLTAPQAPTSSRAGAASAPSFAPKPNLPTLTDTLSMEESACLNVHLGTHALHQTGELLFNLNLPWFNTPPYCCFANIEFSSILTVSLETGSHHSLCMAFKIMKAVKHAEEFHLDMLWLLL